MDTWIEKIENLDLSLFMAIKSQTSAGDKRSLVAVQRAIARKHKEYAFLEIGSYQGGTIQPFLLDMRCKRIYSIDLRPSQLPDDRSPGCLLSYRDNSRERMLQMLGEIGHGDMAKIECFDMDAADVDPRRIAVRPLVIFIDGEHTQTAVLSDFQFCQRIVHEQGAILFHDFSIIAPAVIHLCRQLKDRHSPFVPLKLEGDVFAIFFDSDLVRSDPYLAAWRKKHTRFWLGYRLKQGLKGILPSPALRLLRHLRDAFATRA